MISSGVLKCIKNKGLEFFTFTFTTQVNCVSATWCSKFVVLKKSTGECCRAKHNKCHLDPIFHSCALWHMTNRTDLRQNST